MLAMYVDCGLEKKPGVARLGVDWSRLWQLLASSTSLHGNAGVGKGWKGGHRRDTLMLAQDVPLTLSWAP